MKHICSVVDITVIIHVFHYMLHIEHNSQYGSNYHKLLHYHEFLYENHEKVSKH